MTTDMIIEPRLDDRQASGDSLRILVAFEKNADRERIASVLSDRLPCHVVRVTDGDEIGEALADPSFQVVLAGASLLGGREAIERIRRTDRAPEIVVLIEPGSADALDFLRAGAFQCIAASASADELALVVERAAELRRLRDAAARAEQLETLRTISLAITSTFDRDALLRTIIEAAVDLLKAESGGIYEYDPERGELTIIADYRRSAHLIGSTLKVDEGLAGQLITNGQPFMIVDDYNNWEGRAAIYSDSRPFGAVLEVPLRWGERVIGILYIDDHVDRKFQRHEARLLKLFADQAVIALTNSSLVRRNETRRQKFRKLAEATREIMAAIRTQSLDDLLDSIARHLAEITDAEVTGVLLVRRPGYLRWEASFGHRPDAFRPGAEFAIVSGEKTGLTGHIAQTGFLFNLHGDELVHHFAVRDEDPASASRRSYSVLAIPLKRRAGDQETVVGLLRAENKKGPDDQPHPTVSFTEEDQEVIKIFAEAVVVALELSEQKDRLNRLVESSPDGIIAVDPQGQVTVFNEQAERVLGYSRAEALSTHVRWLYADPQEPYRIGALLHGREDGRLFNYETAMKTKSGEIIPIRHSSTWLYNSRGERIGSVGYLQDLRSLRWMEKRLESLLTANAIVVGAQSLSEGLTRLTGMLASLLPHTYCRILLRDDARQCLDVLAIYVREEMEDSQQLKTALSKRMEIADWLGLDNLLDRGEPILQQADDPTDAPALIRLSRWLELQPCLRYLLLAPLRLSEKVVGLIELGEANAERPFSQQEIDFAALIANNMTALIDRMRLSAEAERRGQLLAALDEASRTMLRERETSKLLKQIIRLAVELVGCTAGGLFENRPQLEELELIASYEIPDQPAWRDYGRAQTHGEGLVGKAARSGETRVDRRYKSSLDRDPLFIELPFEVAVAVPLKLAGEIEAVLFVADETGHQQFGAADLEVLGRFAVQASTALHISRLMNPENRSLGHLKILHKISDYIQQADNLEKILNVVLTGITASYGLGFNRAALLLYDEPRQTLVGRMAIGYIDQAAARQHWEEGRQQGREDFSVYLTDLERNEIQETPLAQPIRKLALPLRPVAPDPLSRAVLERLPDLLPTERLEELPEDFRELFRPISDLIIVPLEARGQILGVLVADNKFTTLPITQNDVETLLTFVNTAAIAIDKHQLLQETKVARERIRDCFKASNALVSSLEPEEVLRDILDKMPGTAGERAWVKLILVDELGKIQKQMLAGIPERPELLVTTLRHYPKGFTMRVMRTGKPVVIEDRARLVPPDESPFMESNGIAASVGLPFLLHGSSIGVMWINYERPRRFESFEIDALQLYVNQSAMAYDSARRMDELKRLHAAAQAISHAHNLHDVLHAIANQAIHVCSAQTAILWPYDQEKVEYVTAEAVAVGMSLSEYHRLLVTDSEGGELADIVAEEAWLSVPDVLDPEFLPASQELGESLKLAGIASFQAVALSARSERVGILYVGYNETRSFGDQDRRTLEAFASHAALCLNNIRLFDRSQKAKQAAELVARLTTLEKRDNTLQTIAETVRAALDCSAVVLFSYTKREDRWSYPPAHAGVRYPEKAWPPGKEISLHRSVVPKVLRLPSPLVAEEVSNSELLKTSRFAQDEEIVSCAVIPLQAAGQKVGVMFANYRNHHLFTPENLRDLELFAYQAAVAILNSQLFEALEKDQLRALQDFQHQIKGPIFQVHSRVQRLLATLPPSAGRRELELIEALSTKAKRVSTYIRLYALLSRGEPLEARDVEISIDDLIKLLHEGAHHACLTTSSSLGCKFRINESSFRATGAQVLILDRNLIEHAIDNVLDNAFKYSYAGIDVRVHGGRTEAGDFRITIVNRGLPILPEEIALCAEREWQSEKARLISSEGRGIGLWIVDNILRSLGGRLEIRPTTPEGETKVSLYFPVSRVR